MSFHRILVCIGIILFFSEELIIYPVYVHEDSIFFKKKTLTIVHVHTVQKGPD
jgi:hypothetical protein